MPKNTTKKVFAAVEDLFFSVKISDAAKRAGIDLEFVKQEDAVLEAALGKPTLIIFDLNFSAINPVGLIERIKADKSLKGISLVGYLSHVQRDLKQKAQEAGCDMVMARSAFSQNLGVILKRHADA
jgi:PleD family two-component response regulator